jgi:hypothetical protein
VLVEIMTTTTTVVVGSTVPSSSSSLQTGDHTTSSTTSSTSIATAATGWLARVLDQLVQGVSAVPIGIPAHLVLLVILLAKIGRIAHVCSQVTITITTITIIILRRLIVMATSSVGTGRCC